MQAPAGLPSFVMSEWTYDDEPRAVLTSFAVCTGATLLAALVLYLMWAVMH